MGDGNASRYVKLVRDQAPAEDITPGELNQPIQVPQVLSLSLSPFFFFFYNSDSYNYVLLFLCVYAKMGLCCFFFGFLCNSGQCCGVFTLFFFLFVL